MQEIVYKNIDKELQITFNADYQNVNKVVKNILGYIETNLIPVSAFDIGVTLHELLVNAVRHGSASDNTKIVHVVVGTESGRLYIKVQDEGLGFDLEKKLCNEKSNVLEPHGMGLNIIKSLGFSLSYNRINNEICVSKELSN
ncbi:MAG: ATP-binding protein [Calditrichae bacterium]|nr:ATP-binding protein [Calditrichota bacterium]MCB9056960.1 ATP-binding protein [Calditrichia bacterium]